MSAFKISIKYFLFIYFILGSAVALSENKTKILLSLPLTGAAASYGNELRGAVEFFAKQLKIDAEFILFDDKCSPREAVTGVIEAIARDSIVAVIGAPCSGVVMAIAPILNEKKIALISLGAMAASISQLEGKIFRVGIKDNRIAETLAPILKDRKVAALVEQTEFAESTFQKLKALVPAAFNEAEHSFSSANSDFNSLVLKVQQAKPDLVFVSAQSGVSLAAIIRAFSGNSSKIEVMTGVFAESPIFRRMATRRSMQISYAASPNRQDCEQRGNKTAKQHFEQFENLYARLESNDFTLVSAEIGIQLLSRLLAGELDINKTTYIESLCGRVSFDSSGDLQGLDLSLVELLPQ